MKPALLVIDIQKEFFGPATTKSLEDAIKTINAAIGLFREKELPIICIQHLNPKDCLVPGEEGFDLPESLAILPSDVHIHKTYSNAFNKTPLAECLRGLGVNTVIVTGFCAEYCVLATCVGAEDADLTPIILVGSLASPVPENIRFVESINEAIAYEALKKVLEQKASSLASP